MIRTRDDSIQKLYEYFNLPRLYFQKSMYLAFWLHFGHHWFMKIYVWQRPFFLTPPSDTNNNILFYFETNMSCRHVSSLRPVLKAAYTCVCTSNVCDAMRALFSCWSEMILNGITNNWKYKLIEYKKCSINSKFNSWKKKKEERNLYDYQTIAVTLSFLHCYWFKCLERIVII